MRLLLSSLLALGLSGCSEKVHASAPRSFPLSESEGQSLSSIFERDRALSSEIAQVESENPRLAAGIRSFRDRSVKVVLDEMRLREAAARAHGVPVVLVISGSSVAWVETSQ